MNTARMRSGLLALLVLLAVTAACTNSEQLNSGVGPVPIEIMIVNSDTEFNRAFFDVTQVTVRPLNPNASEVLGVNPLWLIPQTDDSPIVINLNSDEDLYESDSQLTIGPYEVLSIDLRLIEFTNRERTGNATCLEYITQYPSVQFIQLINFGEPVVVDVTAGTANQLIMEFDGAALTTAFARSWNCSQGIACGLFPPMDWCISPFNETSFNPLFFSQQTPSFLSFP